MNSDLKNKIQDWWDQLDYEIKVELMEDLIPDDIQLIDADDMWDSLDWEVRYEVYCNYDNEVELTDEEREAQITDTAERENHRREVEGREV